MKYLKTLAKWIMVFLGCTGCFFIEYAFSTDTGEVYDSFMFLCTYYELNYVAYMVGLLLFLVGYFLVWKFFLKADWKAYREERWYIKLGYVLLVALTVVGLFYTSFIAMWMSTGWGSYRQQDFLEGMVYAQLIYFIALPTVDLLVLIHLKRNR